MEYINIDKEKFAKKLKKLRSECGHTQEHIYFASNKQLSTREYQNYEAGFCLPDANSLLILARIFSTSIDYLLDDTVEVEHSPTWYSILHNLSLLLSQSVITPLKFDNGMIINGKKVTAIYYSVDSEMGLFYNNLINNMENGSFKKEFANMNICHYMNFASFLSPNDKCILINKTEKFSNK